MVAKESHHLQISQVQTQKSQMDLHYPLLLRYQETGELAIVGSNKVLQKHQL